MAAHPKYQTNDFTLLNDKSLTRVKKVGDRIEKSSVDLTFIQNLFDINIDWWTEKQTHSDHKFVIYNLSNDIIQISKPKPVIRVNDNRPWDKYRDLINKNNITWTDKYYNRLNDVIKKYTANKTLPKNIDINRH